MHTAFHTPCPLKTTFCRTPTSASTSKRGRPILHARAKLNVAIAGGGLGGLTLACYLAKHGVDVSVYEKTRTYRKFGGPIQVQSNALALLQDVDASLPEMIALHGCVTGNRLAAIHDGPSRRALAHFDPGAAARRRRLPLTHVVPRPALQDALVAALRRHAPRALKTGSAVTGYRRCAGAGAGAGAGGGVDVLLGDGVVRRHDVLIGADGIWSAVRAQMNSEAARAGASYSGYRCYTATCTYTASNVERVAYRVHLGGAIYFVSSDVGHGLTQWYAFVSETEDAPHYAAGCIMTELRRLYSGWGADVEDVLRATPESAVEMRDIYDRPPLTKGWLDGDVALLGDAAHPMMPNLGQGGCMAVESAYTLGACLVRARARANADASGSKAAAVRCALQEYERRRMARTAIVHGIARTSSDVLRMYGRDKAFVGWGLFWKTIGPLILGGSMPLLLEYLYINLVEPAPAPAAVDKSKVEQPEAAAVVR